MPVHDMERQIWAAAFAAAWDREYNFGRVHRGWEASDVDGFTCAELADAALDAFRASLVSEDAEYLTPLQEKWFESATPDKQDESQGLDHE